MATIEQETIVYSQSPRHGHGQDVVNEEGIRQVAGCLPIDPTSKRFLLVTSSSNQDVWVIPKGGWETDETQIQAAMRETWEEAGVKGIIQRHIGVFEEKSKQGVKAHHWIYELEIKEITKRFPEKKKRERRWFTYEEALLAVKARYIKEAIKMSSISPEKKKKKKKSKKNKESTDDEDGSAQEEKKKKKNKKKKKESTDDEDGSTQEEKKKKKKKKESTDDESESNQEEKKKKKKKKESTDDESESNQEEKKK
ncbi:NUDIX hydrolase domain-like protein, partial [Sporodiniella umbellata]